MSGGTDPGNCRLSTNWSAITSAWRSKPAMAIGLMPPIFSASASETFTGNFGNSAFCLEARSAHPPRALSSSLKYSTSSTNPHKPRYFRVQHRKLEALFNQINPKSEDRALSAGHLFEKTDACRI